MKEARQILLLIIPFFFVISVFSATAPANPGIPPPVPGTSSTLSTPTGLAATPVSSTSINLVWNSVSGADNYYIYKATNELGPYTKYTATQTSFSSNQLSPSTTYYYKVSAVSDQQESVASSAISATTLSATQQQSTSQTTQQTSQTQQNTSQTSTQQSTMQSTQQTSQSNATQQTTQQQTTQQQSTSQTQQSQQNTGASGLSYQQPSEQIPSQTIQTQEQTQEQQPVQETPASTSNTLYYVLGGMIVLIIVGSAVLILRPKTKPIQPIGAIDPRIQQLKNYIAETLSKGFTREQITANLLQSGYSQQMIDEAMRYV